MHPGGAPTEGQTDENVAYGQPGLDYSLQRHPNAGARDQMYSTHPMMQHSAGVPPTGMYNFLKFF